MCAVEQKDGGSWTNLGKFQGWTDGYSKLKYEHGTKCWNGPERSTIVSLECGSQDEILQVSEPETCNYLIRMATPSTCKESDIPELIGQTHDEL